MSPTEPSRLRMLGRGATRRCPRCGAGKLFHHWFTMVPTCPRCGMKFEREPGYWTGAIAINTIIIGGLFTIVLVVTMILTVPDIPWVTVLMLVVPLMTIGPIVINGMTSIKTVTHGMSGTVRIIVTTSTIVNRPPMMIVLMATAPVQYPGSRSNFIPQRGHVGTIVNQW